MSPSLQNQILSYAVSALQANASLSAAGVTVHRYRTRPIGKDTLPAIVVYPVLDEYLNRVGTEEAPVVERQFRFWVECRAATTDTATPIDEVLDPLYIGAIQALYADPRFGNLLSGLQLERSQWDAFEADRTYGGLALMFAAHFWTLAADATASPG